MDWYVIQYLYPTSFRKFSEMMFPNMGVISLSTLEMYDNKKLYQFFDKNGVYLNVEMMNPQQWLFSISLKNGVVFGPKQDSRSSRDEIEVDGFNECFKILDNILNQNN